MKFDYFFHVEMRTDVNSIYYDGSDDSNYELDCDDILFIICVSLSSSWVKVAAATAAQQQQQQKLPKERAASDPVGHWPLSNQLLLFFSPFFLEIFVSFCARCSMAALSFPIFPAVATATGAIFLIWLSSSCRVAAACRRRRRVISISEKAEPVAPLF